MSPAGYANYRGFARTAGTLPVVAIAALLGSAIGGFSVYAISLALMDTPPPDSVAMKTNTVTTRPLPHDAPAAQTAGGSPQNAASPIRTIGTPIPNLTEVPALLAQPQQNPWPDALSREHPTLPQPPVTAEAPPPASTPPAGSETVAAAPSKAAPPKPLPQKRRVVSRKRAPYQNSGEMAGRSQPVYDYYNDNDRYGYAAPAPRGMNSPPLDLNRLARAVRRPRETRPMLPPQPPPPGLFGGDRDDGWR